jgi:hypothetical protein
MAKTLTVFLGATIGVALIALLAHAGDAHVLPILFVGSVAFCVLGIVAHGIQLSSSRRKRLLEKLASPDFTMISGPPPKVMLVGAFILGPIAIALIALGARLYAYESTHGLVYGSVMLLAGLGFQAGVQRRLSEYLLWRTAWKESREQRRSGQPLRSALNWERKRGQGVL